MLLQPPPIYIQKISTSHSADEAHTHDHADDKREQNVGHYPLRINHMINSSQHICYTRAQQAK